MRVMIKLEFGELAEQQATAALTDVLRMLGTSQAVNIILEADAVPRGSVAAVVAGDAIAKAMGRAGTKGPKQEHK